MAPDRLEDARERSLIISNRIRSKIDETVRNKILGFSGELSGNPEQFGIDLEAWHYIKKIGVKRRLVFAHPNMLRAHPDTSLHYRGIAILPRKRVEQIAYSVDSWEKTPDRARVTEERAHQVACLYNTIISSIILGSTDWTLENGYRNVLATIGITEDGALRNTIGDKAEQAVKDRIAEWLEDQPDVSCESDETRTTWYLGDNLRMVYASEPDIRFERQVASDSWEIVSTIEVKGGTDPAGALERLGAVKKSFDKTPMQAKNFLVVGVVTAEMQNQLNQMRIEQVFILFETLYLDREWAKFVNEVFHHTLRLLANPYRLE